MVSFFRVLQTLLSTATLISLIGYMLSFRDMGITLIIYYDFPQSEPIADNGTQEEIDKNRRVEYRTGGNPDLMKVLVKGNVLVQDFEVFRDENSLIDWKANLCLHQGHSQQRCNYPFKNLDASSGGIGFM